MRLDIVDPKTVLRHLADDWGIAIAASATHPWFRSEAINYQLHLPKTDGVEAVVHARSMGGNAMLAGGQLPSTTINRAQTSDQAALVQERGLLHDKGALVPCLQPMVAHIRSCWAVKQAQAAVSSAVSLVEGRWWTPKRLFESGLSDNPLCELCGAIGDLPHRLASCSARDEFRAVECNVGKPPTDGAVVTGAVYTDGALRGLLPCTRRAGWAFAVVNQLDDAWGRFGAVSERSTSVFRAELHAAVEALRHSYPTCHHPHR